MKLRNRFKVVGVLASAVVAMVTFVPSASALGYPQGPYEIFNDMHGAHMCLDVPGGNPANGVKVAQYGCWGGSMQLWYAEFTDYGPYGQTAYYRWRNVATNKCLDIFGGDPANGVQLQQWDCWADGAAGQMQQWQSVSLDPGSYHVMLKNRLTQKCIDIPGGDPNPDVILWQWDCWSGPMQTWREDWP
jgi:Ricin-type beta-trefoil lectin domain-like